MSVLLPVPLPAASGWTLSDWRAIRMTATADSTGTATIDCGQVDPATQWLVDRLVVQSTSSSASTVRLYESIVDPSRLLDGTPAGNLNSNDYPQGLLIRPSSSLVAQWTGASTGAVCTLNVQARVYRMAGQ